MPQTLLSLGGPEGAPPLHIAPANGFVPESYIPMLRPLMAHYRVVSLPPRALWGDGPPPEIDAQTDWQQAADDLLAGFDQYNLRDVIAVGHSFGGVATLLAAMQDPAPFQALIMLDPTILTRQICQGLTYLRESGNPYGSPLAQKALRRRDEFASADEAFENFREKRLFADWSDEALRFYAEAGTIPAAGGGVTLRWSPQWEAYYFSTGRTTVWEDLPRAAELLPEMPMLFLRGGESDTYLAESAAEVAQILPRAEHDVIPGHGHLFPQSAPDATSARVMGWLRAQGMV